MLILSLKYHKDYIISKIIVDNFLYNRSNDLRKDYLYFTLLNYIQVGMSHTIIHV